MALSILDILTIVVDEVFNSCTDARSAYEYIQRGYARGKPLSQEEMRDVKPILESLNYAAIREQHVAMYRIMHDAAKEQP